MVNAKISFRHGKQQFTMVKWDIFLYGFAWSFEINATILSIFNTIPDNCLHAHNKMV
jgi:hypothetical protein